MSSLSDVGRVGVGVVVIIVVVGDSSVGDSSVRHPSVGDSSIAIVLVVGVSDVVIAPPAQSVWMKKFKIIGSITDNFHFCFRGSLQIQK